MNWLNCDEPKKDLNTTSTGRTLINLSGVNTVPSAMDCIFSFTPFSNLAIPILNWFCNNSPIARTLRFDKWSISSMLPNP